MEVCLQQQVHDENAYRFTTQWINRVRMISSKLCTYINRQTSVRKQFNSHLIDNNVTDHLKPVILFALQHCNWSPITCYALCKELACQQVTSQTNTDHTHCVAILNWGGRLHSRHIQRSSLITTVKNYYNRSRVISKILQKYKLPSFFLGGGTLRSI